MAKLTDEQHNRIAAWQIAKANVKSEFAVYRPTRWTRELHLRFQQMTDFERNIALRC